jgi:hypothetical protein
MIAVARRPVDSDRILPVPDARFICLMRDQMELGISHCRHMVRFDGEHRSMFTALRAAAKRILREKVQRDTVHTSGAIAFLQSAQQRQTEEPSAVLGQDFPDWAALRGALAR